MKIKTAFIPALHVFILCSILLITGCEKYKIKRNYTGNFEFTSLTHNIGYDWNAPYNPVLDTYDTLVA